MIYLDVRNKVLLRERKRHTACRVASTHCAALSGGGGGRLPPSNLIRGRGTPSGLDGGAPPGVNRLKILPSPHPSDTGGKN